MSLWTGGSNVYLKSADFETVEHTEGEGAERHTRYMQEQREKPKSESFSCRKGSLSPLIHSLAHTGVSQVTAAVTHAVTQFAKAEPCLEEDCNLMEEGCPLHISAPNLA